MTKKIPKPSSTQGSSRCPSCSGIAAVVLGLVTAAAALGCGGDADLPQLDSVTPPQALHGETVTLSGLDFGIAGADARVILTAWDDAAELDMSSAIQSWSDTSVVFVVPADVHEEAYVVQVEADGELSNWLDLDIVLPGDPAVSVISPPAAEAGESITISGTGFGDAEGSVIFFPETEATLVSWSATSVVVTVPSDIDSDAIRMQTGQGLLSPWFPFVISEASAPTLSLIQSTILTPRCALSSCHGLSESAGLNLTQGQSYAAMVGISSSQRPSVLRVDPGAPGSSMLYDKVSSSSPEVGSPMPLGSGALPSEQVELIRAWIEAGALDN